MTSMCPLYRQQRWSVPSLRYERRQRLYAVMRIWPGRRQFATVGSCYLASLPGQVTRAQASVSSQLVRRAIGEKWAERVDPFAHPNMRLEVIRRLIPAEEHYFSNDN